MVDDLLLHELIDYNKSRKYCFNNGIININEDIELERKLKSRYNKVSRIKKRFLYLILNSKYVYFCTFTFNNKYLNYSQEYQRDLIKETLYSFDDKIKMILNVDYGKKTERLHYHAIIGTKSKLNLKNYLDIVYPSFSYTEEIRFHCGEDFTRVSKYIDKLSNHALKDSTKGRRIYYNFKGWDNFPNSTLLYKYHKVQFFDM